jgi:signal transduction histidine kinase
MAVEVQHVQPATLHVGSDRVQPGRSARRLWSDDRHIYPAVVRGAGWVALVGVTATVGWMARAVHGQQDYLRAWVLAGAVFAVPGLALTWWSGSHVAESDRRVWRLWFVGYGISLFGAASLLAVTGHGWAWVRFVWIASVGLSICAYGAGNALMMRSRAGLRACAPDVLDLTSLVVAVTAPVALAAGDAIIHAEDTWFVLTWAVIAVALVYGAAVAGVLTARIRRQDRQAAWLALALALAALADAAGQVELGVTGFRVGGAGAMVAWHALACGVGFMFVLYANRRASVGLDRLPPQGQVRRTNVVTVLVLSSVPVLLFEAFWSQNTPWVVLAAAVCTAVLLALSSMRHLLVARETAQLYALVEEAADERRQLLADVLSHASADRHRVASRLHQQAMTSYSAMASFVTALERSPMGPPEAALGLAAARARTDLAQQVDTLRDVLATVAPPASDGEQRLVAPLRAYVDSLYLDGCKPALTVTVDKDVVPDWTTEVIVLRIAQAAIDNIHRHAECSRIAVTVAVDGRELVVDIEDDGVGFDPARATDGSGLATMRMLARFIDGRVEVTSVPGEGTLVRAVLGSNLPPGRPDLHLVTGQG